MLLDRVNHGTLPRGLARRAFTLIEVLLVVAILGIAGVLVIPSMSQVGVLRVQAAVRTAVADITYLQSDAVAFQSRRAIMFGVVPRKNALSGLWEFVNGNGYSLAEVRGPVLDLDTDAIMDPDEPNRPYGRDFDLPEYGGAQLADPAFNGTALLIFDELGGPVAELDGPDPGNGGTFTLRGSGSTFLITVQAYTGRVRVTRTEDENP
jgi:prepilin-type N-terminal cleavage/methylation domain-containing protein